MSLFAPALLLLLAISFSDDGVQAHRITLRLIEWSHPQSTQINNQKCDHDSPCDPVFNIKIFRDSNKREEVISISNKEYTDKTHILFNESDSTFHGTLKSDRAIPTTLPLVLVVAEKNAEKISIIDMYTTLLTPPQTEYNLTGNFQSNHSFLRVQLTFQCADNMYGPLCGTLCMPSESTHFGCNKDTGAMVCEKGYLGQTKNSRGQLTSCERKDPCLLKPPCQFSGQCQFIEYINELDSRDYRCNCLDNLIGSHCEERDTDSACQHEICVNGGKCVKMPNGASTCRCPPRFGGEFCEKVAWKEKAKILRTCQNRISCLNNGSCLPHPLVGADICFCQPGFGGPRCEFPVAWRANYDEMRLWADIVRNFTHAVPVPWPPKATTVTTSALQGGSQIARHSITSTAITGTHVTLNQSHFTLIVASLACLTVVVLVMGVFLVYRYRNSEKFSTYWSPATRRTPLPSIPTIVYGPSAASTMVRPPFQSSNSSDTVSTTVDYTCTSTIGDEYLCPDPGTIYEEMESETSE